MSEFYRLRRASIRDVSSLAAFLIGFLVSAPFGWGFLTADVAAYNFTRGVMRFVLVIFGGGALFGVAGMALGSLLGLLWEHNHKRGRGEVPVKRSGRRPSSHRPPLLPERSALRRHSVQNRETRRLIRHSGSPIRGSTRRTSFRSLSVSGRRTTTPLAQPRRWHGPSISARGKADSSSGQSACSPTAISLRPRQIFSLIRAVGSAASVAS